MGKKGTKLGFEDAILAFVAIGWELLGKEEEIGGNSTNNSILFWGSTSNVIGLRQVEKVTQEG